MRMCENFGRTSAPFLPQRVQVKVWFDVGEPDIVGPAVGVGFDVMATSMIAAIDQDVADAGFAHFPEGYFLRVRRHDRLRTTRPLAS